MRYNTPNKLSACRHPPSPFNRSPLAKMVPSRTSSRVHSVLTLMLVNTSEGIYALVVQNSLSEKDFPAVYALLASGINAG